MTGYLQAVFSALLLAAALPNEVFLEGLWPLGLLALLPLYRSLLEAKGFGAAARRGALFGACAHALSSYWLYFYRGFAFWTLGSTTLAYGLVYAVAACYGKFVLDRTPAAYRPFLFALGWVSLEYLKSIGFLGYPWGLVAYSLTSVPLFLQTADVAGVYGIGLVLALSSAVLAEAGARGTLELSSRPASAVDGSGRSSAFLPRQALVLCLLEALCLGYGAFRLNAEIPAAKTVSAVLVQQNTDPWISGELAALKANIELARKALPAPGSAEPGAVDLVVFSETSLRRPYEEFAPWFAENPARDPLIPFIKASGAHLLTGAPIILDWDSWAATNSVILVSPGGGFLDSYAKVHPVPFAEAIPLWEYAWFRNFMKEVVGLEAGWVMGKELKVFRLPLRGGGSLAFSTPICFEDAFSDLCRRYFLAGAELLINLTNDSWSARESAQIQHWAIARFRAIENRRTLVRSTNAGVTCVVDPWGRNSLVLPQFVGASALVRIPVYGEASPTLFTRCGDWFALLALSLFAASLIIEVIREVRGGRHERA